MFEGIIPPMVTPLRNENALDTQGLENLIEHLIAGGVNGLFILGTTGEGPSLGYPLQVELIERVCKQVNERVPVLVGITDVSYKQSIYMAEKSKENGAEAVVLAPPFYFQINQEELYNYMSKLIDEISLPVFLYNYPDLTKIEFGINTLRKLLRQSGVIGIKDSSGNMGYFHKVKHLTNKKNIPLLMGPEELLMEALIMGGNGGVAGGANIFPKLYVEMYQNVQSGHLEKALILHKKIIELSSVVYSGDGNNSSRIISGIKKALFYLDICSDYVAMPLTGMSDEKASKIRGFIHQGLSKNTSDG